jgi:hypothetical protein
MPTLRSLRLLGSVEAGTTDGTTLQTFLTDAGRNAEFSVLLSMRGQSRRMASNELTMTAITTSAAARDAVFKSATTATSAACQAVVASAVAMGAVAISTPSLITVADNPVAWGLFNKSPFYEVNIKNVIGNYAAINPASHSTVTGLVSDPDAMASIAAAPYAVSALVASPATTTIVAASSVSMALLASNSVAIDIVAKETAIMGIIANSTPAMTEIISRSVATNRIAKYPGAISAVAASSTAFAQYLGGPFFSANLPLALANMIGVSPATFPTLASIIASASALSLVANSLSAVQALASNADAMTALSVSPNLGIILSSAVAMSVIGPNTVAMTSFLNASGAWSGLFSSSVAKGFIVSSTPLVNVVAGNAALITYLKTLSVVASATGIPDGNATALQPFTGLPAKVLTLLAKEAGIAATFSNYNFGGSVLAGSQAGNVLALTAAAQLPHVAGYTGMTWNLGGIGVTAATLPIITYVDMT